MAPIRVQRRYTGPHTFKSKWALILAPLHRSGETMPAHVRNRAKFERAMMLVWALDQERFDIRRFGTPPTLSSEPVYVLLLVRLVGPLASLQDGHSHRCCLERSPRRGPHTEALVRYRVFRKLYLHRCGGHSRRIWTQGAGEAGSGRAHLARASSWLVNYVDLSFARLSPSSRKPDASSLNAPIGSSSFSARSFSAFAINPTTGS